MYLLQTIIISYDTNNSLNIFSNNKGILSSNGTTLLFPTDFITSSTSNTAKQLLLESTNASGSSKITFKARSTNTASIFIAGGALFIDTETSNPISFRVNTAGTLLMPLNLYTNGVVNVGNNAMSNKQLVLYDTAPTDDPVTATFFYGFGVNSGTLRYQAASTTSVHKFYCGTTLGYTISNTGGVNLSDIRFKSDLQNITNGLDKINQLQGKSFYLHNDRSQRQIGLIAQEVEVVIPEVIYTDTSDENNYKFIAYDKIVSVLIEAVKELSNKINVLENRIQILENK